MRHTKPTNAFAPEPKGQFKREVNVGRSKRFPLSVPDELKSSFGRIFL